MRATLIKVLNTSARLLRLLSLFQAQRYWPGAALCDRLEVTARTLRRDVDRLRSLGYPVHSTSGIAGGYQLAAGATLPPLLLDDEEAVAVAVGLRTAASGSVAGIEESSVRALAKLEQVLPSRLRRRVEALHSAVVPMPNTFEKVNAAMLASIASACRDSESIRFQYKSRDGSATSRQVEPHRLVHTGRRWYLAAWDIGRDDWRTFRVDRIEHAASTGARFKKRSPPDGDFVAYVARSIAYAPYAHQVTVLLRTPLAAAAEKIPPSVGLLEAVDQDTCLLRMGAPSLDGMSAYLAYLGFDFEVREPVELVHAIRSLAHRFIRATRQAARDAPRPNTKAARSGL
ncbi:MAG TPA: YafY family protein [Bryobacteraceae bacterium]|nr:YafY family protein [Bryobacteraceae bacterium]